MAFFVLWGCEGPAGLDGEDGKDGIDGIDGVDGKDGVDGGTASCLSCHDSDNQTLVAIQFGTSAHSMGAIAVDYAGGRASCAECHSHEGFVEFALTGDVSANIANPSAWECNTCHALHTDFAADDYALRLAEPITFLAGGTTVDEGNNNLCMNCHQSRRGVGDYDNATEDQTITRTFTGDDIEVYKHAAVGPAGSITEYGTDSVVVVFDVPQATHAYISSTHAGPHHGPQGNVWQGVGGTVDGSPYGAHSGGCTKCHMGPDSGHSFWAVEGNCQVDGCHSSSKQDDLDDFAKRVSDVGAALEALHAVHYSDGAYHPVYASLERGQFNAWWNFMLLLEDRSNGAHNPTYYETLLTSIETELGL